MMHGPTPRWTIAPWLVSTALAVAAAPCAGAVVYEPVPASVLWPDAVEPGALRLACAPDLPELEALFGREGLPFRPELVRRETGRLCHLFYRPSAPGFRAAPDDDPVTGITFDTDPVLYLAAGLRTRGDAAGAMREILQRIPRPLDVSILIHRVHAPEAYARATLRSFGATPHRVVLLDRGVERTFWWAQDWMKAGTLGGRPATLVPRRVFEGKPETASAFDPMLDRFAARAGVVRSRLSWEGGDLQLVRDPRDPRRLLLFHGSFAKEYWAGSLSPGEYEYVLCLELGADRAVDLAGIAPHVDYFVSLVPAAGLALVGEPVTGDLAVARAAVEALLTRFGGRGPATLAALRSQLVSPTPSLDGIRQALAQARRESPQWQLAVDPTLPDRMRALVARVCPASGDCLSPASQERMMIVDSDTFEDWVYATQAARDEGAVVAAHLDLVESQVTPVPDAIRRRVAEAIRAIEATGFRIVRVPAYRVDLNAPRSWPGISYVNALVVDRQVFMPRFGLGEAEERVFRETGARLPAGYSIVPVDAQPLLVRNGGLHCLAGILR